MLRPFVGAQDHRLGEIERGELRVDRHGDDRAGERDIVGIEPRALWPEHQCRAAGPAVDLLRRLLGREHRLGDPALAHRGGIDIGAIGHGLGQACRTPARVRAPHWPLPPPGRRWGWASHRAGQPAGSRSARNSAWRGPPCRYSRRAGGGPGLSPAGSAGARSSPAPMPAPASTLPITRVTGACLASCSDSPASPAISASRLARDQPFSRRSAAKAASRSAKGADHASAIWQPLCGDTASRDPSRCCARVSSRSSVCPT